MNAADWKRTAEQLPPVAALCIGFVAGKDDGTPEAGNGVKKDKSVFAFIRPAASDDAETLAWAQKQHVTHWTTVERPASEG